MGKYNVAILWWCLQCSRVKSKCVFIPDSILHWKQHFSPFACYQFKTPCWCIQMCGMHNGFIKCNSSYLTSWQGTIFLQLLNKKESQNYSPKKKNQCSEIKTLRLKRLGKVDLIDLEEILFFSLQSSLHCSYLPPAYISLLVWLWLLSYTPSTPNPHCDYHIMLLTYYQNGADLAFVVAKDWWAWATKNNLKKKKLRDSVIKWWILSSWGYTRLTNRRSLELNT